MPWPSKSKIKFFFKVVCSSVFIFFFGIMFFWRSMSFFWKSAYGRRIRSLIWCVAAYTAVAAARLPVLDFLEQMRNKELESPSSGVSNIG